MMLNIVVRRRLLVAALSVFFAAPRATAQSAAQAGPLWRFELVATPPACTTSLLADAVKVQRDSGAVLTAWRESGCPLSPGGSPLRWSRRDAASPLWTTRALIDPACTSLGCPGLRGEPPAFALRPDGTPFYVYAALGEYEWYYVTLADLGLHSSGPGVLTQGLAHRQSSRTYRMAADFPANAAPDAVPDRVVLGDSLTLNGATIETAAVGSLDYASGPTGQHHVVFWGSLPNDTSHYYYSNGTPGTARPILEAPASRGVHVAVDASNRIHVAASGGPEDINFFWSRLLYLTSDDGVTWTRTDLDPGLAAGHANGFPTIALDSQGRPAIAYWRYPDEIRVTRFDGAAWHDGLLTKTGSTIGEAITPQLAFDEQDRPVVFFHHAGTNALLVAHGSDTPSANVASRTLAVSVLGAGAVASTPARIACPGACQATFANDAYVALTATPDPGSVFVGWAGACTGLGPCVVTLSESASVGAVFAPAPPRNQIVVDTTSQAGSAGACSLGDAIRAANTDLPVNGCAAGSGPDTIVVPAGLYSLDTAVESGAGLPAIWSDVVIQGAGSAETRIERDAGAPAFRIFYAYQPGRLTLNAITVRRGRNEGGGLYMTSAPVFINDSVFADNDAGDDGNGGAISNRNGSPLLINRSSFIGNRGPGGGAISSADGLSINDATFFANTTTGYGGALHAAGTTLVLNSRFVGNHSTYVAGAIYNTGTLTVLSSNFEANVLDGSGGAGGALHSDRTLTLVDTTFSNNQANNANGGAVGNSGVATIVGSTFTQNQTSGDGGALWSYGSQTSVLSITNSTISGNRSGRRGGGIALLGYGSLALSSVTLTANEASTAFGSGPAYGGGFFATSQVSMRNTILAGNSDLGGSYPGFYPDCLADVPVTSLGYNLFGDAESCGVAFQPSDRRSMTAAPLDARLGPLADNGGATMTHALLAGSPAVEGGNPAEPASGGDACPPADQRGVARPQRALCDVGAFERPNGKPRVSVEGATTPEDTPVAVSLVASDPEDDSLTVAVVGEPRHGVLTGTFPHFVYTPAADFNGWDDFRVAASDAFDSGEATTITIHVTPVNDPPIAVDDDASVIANGGSQTINVLANDDDAPDGGETLSVSAVGAASHGTASVGAGGAHVIYKPSTNYVGLDSFTYTLADGNGGLATATVHVTVLTSSDIEVVLNGPIGTNLAAGDNLPFTLTVVNHGPGAATNVRIALTLPPELSFFIACSAGATTCVYEFPTVPPNVPLEQRPQITIPVYATASGQFVVRAALVNAADIPDPLPGNDEALAYVNVAAAADLSLSKAGPNGPVHVGESFRYFLRVRNAGGLSASNVVVTDPLPAAMVFKSASAGCSATGQIVTCTTASLPVNYVADFEIEVVPEQVGAWNNVASLSFSPQDPNTPPVTAAATTTVIEGHAELRASVSGAPDPVLLAADSELTYTIVVSNFGPSKATGITLVAPLPEGALPLRSEPAGTRCGYDPGTRTLKCFLEDLDNGQSSEVVLVMRPPITSPPSDAPLVLRATVDADQAEPSLAIGAVNPLVTDLALAIEESADPAPAGGVLTYTVRIQNNGAYPATGVSVHNVLLGPNPWHASGATCLTGPVDAAGIWLSDCVLGDIASHASASYTLSQFAIIDDQPYHRTYSIDANVSSNVPDPQSSNDAGHADTKSAPAVDLSIINILRQGQRYVGDPLVFDIFVSGPDVDPAPKVEVRETLPQGSVLLRGTGDGWTCSQNELVVTCKSGFFHGSSALSLFVSVPAESVPFSFTAEVWPFKADGLTPLLDPYELDNSSTANADPFLPRLNKRAMVIVVENNQEQTYSVNWSSLASAFNGLPLGSFLTDIDPWLRFVVDKTPGANALLDSQVRKAQLRAAAQQLEATATSLGLPQGQCAQTLLAGLGVDPQIGPSDPRNAWDAMINAYGEQFLAECLAEMAGPYYDKVEVLTDTGATFGWFKQRLEDLHAQGYTIDLLIDVHGCGQPATMNNGVCRASNGEPMEEHLLFAKDPGATTAPGTGVVRHQDISSINGGTLRLGSVYMVSCWGSHFNETWLDLGAKASNGALELNYYTLVSPIAFLDAFTRGQRSLAEAAQIAYQAERPLMTGLFSLTVDLRSLGCIGCVKTYDNAGLYYGWALNGILSRGIPPKEGFGADPNQPIWMEGSSRRVHQTRALTQPDTRSVSFDDPSTHEPLATIVFSETGPGTIFNLEVSEGAAIPSNFSLGLPPVVYALTSNRTFSGTAHVCFHYDPARFADESSLRLMHFENGDWRDQTAVLFTADHVICADVTSFSPFAVVQPNHSPIASAGADQLLEATFAGGAVAVLDASGSGDPDKDALTYTWTGPFGTLSGPVVLAALPRGTHTIALGVADGNGGSSTDTLVVTVRDTSPPTIAISSPQPKTYHFGESVLASFSCADAGSAVASCVGSVASGAPIDTGSAGVHSFTVTAIDAAGNTDSRSVSYTVDAPPGEPGKMTGEGEVGTGSSAPSFSFRIKEREIGDERGHLSYTADVSATHHGKKRENRFRSTRVDGIVFSDDPAFQPGRRPKPTVDTAVFRGVGTWNEAPGYSFEARATDRGEPGRGRDTFELTIRDPHGTVVATVNGALASGNIQSSRLAGH